MPTGSRRRESAQARNAKAREKPVPTTMVGTRPLDLTAIDPTSRPFAGLPLCSTPGL